MSAESQTIVTPSDYSKGAESTSSIPCGICRRQFSRYTCPKCNLLYCSLQCFRSPAHADCSEAFYRKEVEDDIRTTPSKTAEERQKMMEMLKRFEEDAANVDQDFLEDEDEDDDENDDLASKLESMDLENASYEEIWSALTPSQRETFLKALNDPSSELAQQLLASEELEKQIEEPWWERPPDISDNSNVLRSSTKSARYGTPPKIMEIPPAALNASTGAASTGPSLLYNIFATLVAYAYVTRYLSTSPLSSISPGDPEHEEARRLLSGLVPFVTDRRSKTVLPSLSGLITHLWSRFEPGSMTPSFFALLMRDAARLLRPSAVVAISSAAPQEAFADHPAADALRALSDVAALFERSAREKTKTPNPVAAKLAFYAARIVATPPYVLTALADEAVARARLVGREEELDIKQTAAAAPGQTRAAKPRIEELT